VETYVVLQSVHECVMCTFVFHGGWPGLMDSMVLLVTLSPNVGDALQAASFTASADGHPRLDAR
jgi:hypothetical protein